MKWNKNIDYLGLILGVLSSIYGIYQFASDNPLIAIIIILSSILVLSLYFNIKFLKNSKCPYKTKSRNCPLGVVEMIKNPADTLKEILNVEKEYFFLGEGGNNVFRTIHDMKQDRKKFVEDSKLNNKKYNFIIRNFYNQTLINHQQKLRYDEDFTESVKRQIENSYFAQNEFRKRGVDINTFLSNELCKFRIVIVDDNAYVNFYTENNHALKKTMIKIKNEDTPYNLFKWFKSYVEISQKDIERQDSERLSTKSLIIKKQTRSEQKDHDCVFCDIVFNLSKEKCDKLIFVTKNFVAFPAKGHFKEGYLLLIPRKCIASFAEIQDKELIEEYEKLLKEIRNVIKQKFSKDITIFEHGSLLGGNYAGNTIEHAHLHIIPHKIDFLNKFINDYQTIKKVDSISDIFTFNTPYLFFDDGVQRIASPVNNSYKSQYLRRYAYSVIHPERQDNGWNWKVNSHTDILEKTLEKFELQ